VKLLITWKKKKKKREGGVGRAHRRFSLKRDSPL
jgi:hypothetical protein